MEGDRGACSRKLARRFEPGRLEDERLAAAYELLWPLARRSVKQRSAGTEAQDRTIEAVATARRA
jgi:hypothetical protein